MKNTIDIGLLWHSDRSGNLGVGALTVGNIAIVRGVLAEMELVPSFVIHGFADTRAPYIHDADVTFSGVRFSGFPAYFAAMGATDCVLDIGGGDSFTDIYPPKRYLAILIAKALTIVHGVPLLLSPQTIGPFTRDTALKKLFDAIAFWTMRRSRAVVVRDAKSADAVRQFTPGVEPIYSVDVAFALPWTPAPSTPGRRRVGLNISGLLWNGGHRGRHEFGLGYDYKALMTALIEALLARDDCTIELVCHVNGYPGSPEDDGTVADALAARWPQLVRVPDFASPSEAKSHISGLDFLVAARMHACIAAFSSGIPVVPVSYSRKFEGLFGSLGYDHLVPHTGMATEAALAFILDAMERGDALKATIATSSEQVKLRLEAYRGALRALFGSLPPG